MKKVFVSGKVQGVFFRESAKRKAVELGVVGWVVNLDDGRVEMALEGDRVDEMLDWVREGPPSAQVEKVEVEEIETSRDLQEFKIKR